MNTTLVFPVIAKPWFWTITTIFVLADFLVGFDIFHSTVGFFLFMGTLGTLVLLGLEAVLQVAFEISYKISWWRMMKKVK